MRNTSERNGILLGVLTPERMKEAALQLLET